MRYLYGPVLSRRLGLSLGIDLFSGRKYCDFNCIYCQLGAGKKRFLRRIDIVDFNVLEWELKEKLGKIKEKLDYISLSGTGEPTLHCNLDKIIAIIKNVCKKRIPVCVITNSSLLYLKKVRTELKEADLVIPSLDAGCARTFKVINQAYSQISFRKIVNGIINFTEGFRGKVWVEIMLVKGINDREDEFIKIKKIVEQIKCDKIQINLPVRLRGYSKIPDLGTAKLLKDILGEKAEIIGGICISGSARNDSNSDLSDDEILAYLKRRPATIEELMFALGMGKRPLEVMLRDLERKKRIILVRSKYYFNKGRCR